MYRPSPRRSRWRPGRSRSLAFAAAVLLAGPAAAQQTGQIVVTALNAETNQPLAGVQVSVPGTDLGGLTNNEGRYLILNVPVGEQRVTATLLGFGEGAETVTVTAGGTATVQFDLRARAVELEGVVVTGTPIAARRREIGNSIGLVTAEQIEAVPAVQVDDILRSKVPGLSISGTSGQAGAGSDFILRGQGSVNGRNRPLIYIDGVRVNDQGVYEEANEASVNATVLNSLNPEDIDRVEVIKGAAATTLYGTDASAGVIQIFTKRGAPGEARWTLNAGFALATPPHVGPKMDPTGLHMNDCTANGPVPSDTTAAPDPGCPSSGSWLRNAPSHDYSLSVQGGVENISYFVSGAFSRAEGMINAPDPYDPQAANSINLRANFSFEPAQDLQLQWNNAYSRRDIRWYPDGDNAEGLSYNVSFLDQGDTPDDDDSRIFEMDILQDIDHFTTGGTVNWTPRDNLRHRFTAGFDWSNSNQRTERPWQFWDFADGSRTVDIENSRVLTLDYAGSWNTSFTEDIGSTLSWGGQFSDREELGLRGDCEGFVGPGTKVTENCRDYTNINEDREGFRNGGFFLQEQLGWKNRFFLTGGFRADTHSSFSDDLQLASEFVIYPKLQATYTLSDHAFWPQWFETFRLRGAWGKAGEAPDPEDSQIFWQVAGADENEQGFIILNVGNANIGPERTEELEAGFDASMINGRIVLSATLFNRNTTQGIIGIDLPPSSGVVEQIPTNVGRWEANGVEATMDLGLLELDDARLRFRGQYSYARTEMLEFGPDEDNFFSLGYYDNFYRIGDPIPSTYGIPVLNPDEVGVLPEFGDTTEFIGTTRPPHELSVGADLQLFNRLTLSAFGLAQFGHVLIDDQAQELAAVGLWPECVATNQTVEAYFDAGEPAGGLGSLTAGEIAHCSERWARNADWMNEADYFRLQSLGAAYRIPERFLPGRINAATLQFTARNLALFTDFPGIDPDAIIGPASYALGRAGGYILPLPRTYSVNLRLSF
jgi:TonB-dependent starch-binding outer membrane protein SusC